MGKKRKNSNSNTPHKTASNRVGLNEKSSELDYAPIAKAPPVDRWFQLALTNRNFSVAMRLSVALTRVQDYFVHLFVREREAGTLFHFAPLIFGLGIATYFSTASEPFLSVLLVTAALLFFTTIKMKEHGFVWLALAAMTLFVGGMGAAKIRTLVTNTHPLVEQLTTNISGTVIEVSQNSRGSPRYLVQTDAIEDILPNDLPQRVRLSSAKKHPRAIPGDYISGLARFRALTGPAYPGGFDFSFNSWFSTLGASGFFMGKPELVKAPANPHKLPIWLSVKIKINLARMAIARRIKAALPGENGDVAVALITGERTGIDRETQESLRRSGLAHVLAISGMHMALVCLTMVWAVRFILALNVRLALQRPIKNWAALAGFVTASSYLLISGMSLATQRAWIMISILILAVLVRRNSLTLRSVAIAAMAILIVQPEALLSPGFQMSFAAVAAIVAAYEWLDGRRKNERGLLSGNRIVRFFAALIFTSFIAGLATGLFAAYHFHRIAPFGVLTNLLAMPLISSIVMPMALLSVLAMPYGLEQFPLTPMGAGIDWVIEISSRVNALSNSANSLAVTGKMATIVLPMSLIGLFLLTMLKTPLRISGIIILIATMFFWRGADIPDILLSEDGRAIAVKIDNHQLALLYPRRNKFIRQIWSRAFSRDQLARLEQKSKQNSKDKSSASLCNRNICYANTLQGAKLVVVYDPKLLDEACENADILLAPRLRWVNCPQRVPAVIIRRGELEEFGAHAFYLEKIAKDPLAPNDSTGFSKSSQNSQANRIITKISPKPLELEDILIATIPEAPILPIRTGDENLDADIKVSNDKSQWVQPARGFRVVRIEKSIPISTRPWNRHRKGRAKYRQD